eukprot:3687453-Amphidinium_carterae.2
MQRTSRATLEVARLSGEFLIYRTWIPICLREGGLVRVHEGHVNLVPEKELLQRLQVLSNCLWALSQNITNVDRCNGDVTHLASVEVGREPSRHSGNSPLVLPVLSDEFVVGNHLKRRRPPQNGAVMVAHRGEAGLLEVVLVLFRHELQTCMHMASAIAEEPTQVHPAASSTKIGAHHCDSVHEFPWCRLSGIIGTGTV